MRTLSIEQQLAELAQVGLSLEAGVTVDDLLISWERGEYERIPFRRLLRALGSESRGQPMCRRAWTFDTECIVHADDYVPIVNRLAAMADAGHRLRQVQVEGRGADTSLRYALDGRPRQLPIAIADDWADLPSLCAIMAELAKGEEHFYGQLDGQGLYLFFLPADAALRINTLAEGHVVLSVVTDWVHDTRSRRARPDASLHATDPAALADAVASYTGAGTWATVPYDMSKRFAVNDQLTHPVFGAGIVVRCGDTQIDVLFGEGLRTLTHGRR